MDPPYQRKGDIWSEHDKAYLIDSIINGFDIPKFYFADFARAPSRLSKSDCSYAVIDGKQRLEAIFRFFEGDLNLNKNFVWRQDPKNGLGGLSYEELRFKAPEAAESIDAYTIDVMSVVAEEEDDVHEIFKRLNRGRALTGAELRNAASGPVADMVRILASKPFFRHSVRFSTKRMNDANAAAKILLFEYRGYPTSTKKKDLDGLYSLEADPKVIEKAGLSAISTLSNMHQIFERSDILLSNSGQVPAFYWFVGLLPRNSHSRVRAFLEKFHGRRIISRKHQAENRLDKVEPQIARYDVLDRNTNDAGSHRARISILLNEYAKYLNKNGEEGIAKDVAAIHKDYVRRMKTDFEALV